MNDDYLAGFLDGEGCFFITVTPRASGHYYRSGIHIGSTNRAILDEIRSYLGVGFVALMNKHENRKQAYQFILCNKKHVHPILKRILPKLHIKNKQVSLLIDFFDRINSSPVGRRRLPPSEIEAVLNLS